MVCKFDDPGEVGDQKPRRWIYSKGGGFADLTRALLYLEQPGELRSTRGSQISFAVRLSLKRGLAMGPGCSQLIILWHGGSKKSTKTRGTVDLIMSG